MGSSQSKGGSTNLSPITNPNPNLSPTTSVAPQSASSNDDDVPSSWSAAKHNIRQGNESDGRGAGKKTKKDPTQLSGVALIEYKCRKKKRAWSRCVSDHYEQKFLPGKALEPEEDCDGLFDSFRACYLKGMLRERQKMGAPPPKEGTVLYEFMEDEGMFADLVAAERK
jgi:hypothetical protein